MNFPVLCFCIFFQCFLTCEVCALASARDLIEGVSFFFTFPVSHDSALTSVSFHSGHNGARRNRFASGLNQIHSIKYSNFSTNTNLSLKSVDEDKRWTLFDEFGFKFRPSSLVLLNFEV